MNETMFNKLNSIKIVEDSYNIFKDNQGYPNFDFKTSDEFEGFIASIKAKYAENSDYNNNKLTDFFMGLEEIMQKYGYSIMDRIDKPSFILPPSEDYEYIYKHRNDIFSEAPSPRMNAQKILDTGLFLNEEDKYKLENALNAIAEAGAYIKNYSDYEYTSSGGASLVDGQVSVSDTLSLASKSDMPFSEANRVILISHTTPNDDVKNEDYINIKNEIKEYIIAKFSEISKTYLSDMKKFVANLNSVVIKGDIENSINIQLDTMLNKQDLVKIADTMVQYL